MGMAASQARLLSITARVHDVELEAQDIMSKKVALATQRDELYSDYCAALDAKKLQIAFRNGEGGKLNYVDATFANVCGYNPDRNGNYAITDVNSGKMLVEKEVYDAYKNFQGGDKYAFALQMLGFTAEQIAGPPLYAVLVGIPNGTKNQPSMDTTKADGSIKYAGGFLNSQTGLYDGYVLMTNAEAAVYERHQDDTVSNNLSSLMAKFEQTLEKGDRKEVEKAINNFRSELYSKYSGEIYSSACETLEIESPAEFSSDLAAQFQYYAQLFEGIEAMGGCVCIDDYSENGDTGNDWFNNVINTGRVLLNEYVTSGTQKGWKEISVATSTNVQETKDDADLKKAEAKYEYELNKINRKDTQYDQDLNKLETERNALNKEMESVKKVKDENIERTFKIFS